MREVQRGERKEAERREELGRNALKVVHQNEGAVGRTVDMMVQHLAERDFYVAPEK